MIRASYFYFAVVNRSDRLLPWTISNRRSDSQKRATDYLASSSPKTWDSCKRDGMRVVKVRVEGFNE